MVALCFSYFEEVVERSSVIAFLPLYISMLTASGHLDFTP